MEGGELQGGSAVLTVTDEKGRAADAGADMGTRLLKAAYDGDVDAMRALLEHPSADPAAMLMHAHSQDGYTALMFAALSGQADAMRVLLDYPAADPAAMMMCATNAGFIALTLASRSGHVDAMRVLLDHPAADPAAMLMHRNSVGCTALLYATFSAAQSGLVDAMRLLLDHPAADPGAMMMHSDSEGGTALVYAARNGNMDAMHLLLDHPAADPAAMISFLNGNCSALLSAAIFAASGRTFVRTDAASASAVQTPTWDCAPLLFLLRRVAVDPHPSDAQQVHMSMVMEAMCDGPLARSRRLLDDDHPDAVREACVRLLLEHGARFDSSSPAGLRVRRELASWAWRFAGD
jgi:ankyrin repeat protein